MKAKIVVLVLLLVVPLGLWALENDTKPNGTFHLIVEKSDWEKYADSTHRRNWYNIDPYPCTFGVPEIPSFYISRFMVFCDGGKLTEAHEGGFMDGETYNGEYKMDGDTVFIHKDGRKILFLYSQEEQRLYELVPQVSIEENGTKRIDYSAIKYRYWQKVEHETH
ncbi:MAG: hypothetical protein QM642_00990 [Edaphocola sp.]